MNVQKLAWLRRWSIHTYEQRLHGKDVVVLSKGVALRRAGGIVLGSNEQSLLLLVACSGGGVGRRATEWATRDLHPRSRRRPLACREVRVRARDINMWAGFMAIANLDKLLHFSRYAVWPCVSR